MYMHRLPYRLSPLARVLAWEFSASWRDSLWRDSLSIGAKWEMTTRNLQLITASPTFWPSRVWVRRTWTTTSVRWRRLGKWSSLSTELSTKMRSVSSVNTHSACVSFCVSFQLLHYSFRRILRSSWTEETIIGCGNVQCKTHRVIISTRCVLLHVLSNNYVETCTILFV